MCRSLACLRLYENKNRRTVRSEFIPVYRGIPASPDMSGIAQRIGKNGKNKNGSPLNALNALRITVIKIQEKVNSSNCLFLKS